MSGERERQIRQVIAELELLSHGSTQSWNTAGGHSDESHSMPRPEEYPHDYWARRLAEAGEDEAKLAAVLKGARGALDAWRGGIRPEPKGETAKELDARIVLTGEGWSVQEVAVSLRVSTTLVRKARLAAGRNLDTGKPAAVSLERVGEHERARELAAQGMSERQIRMLTGLPKTTVRRILGRAA